MQGIIESSEMPVNDADVLVTAETPEVVIRLAEDLKCSNIVLACFLESSGTVRDHGDAAKHPRCRRTIACPLKTLGCSTIFTHCIIRAVLDRCKVRQKMMMKTVQLQIIVIGCFRRKTAHRS